MSARLEVAGLAKRFGPVAAVDSFSHAFAAGRITAIVGPSGSGKSTALAMIAGLLEPDAGRIVCDGHDITRVPTERRDFGLVFQSYALFPHMTVRENVEFGLRVRKASPELRRQRGEEAMELARIAPLARRRVQQLSGGEQQRVALARALAFRPRLLMLDEPLSALDAQLREQLRAELAALLRSLELTAIYVTHDQLEAMSLAHELIVMNGGRIEQQGSPEEIYARPANRFVAAFFGSASLVAGICFDTPQGRRLALPFAELELDEHTAPGRCWAVLRPEDLELAGPGPGVFQAVVESAVFLGDRVRVRMNSEGVTLVTDLPGSSVPAAGAKLDLRLRERRLHLLSRET